MVFFPIAARRSGNLMNLDLERAVLLRTPQELPRVRRSINLSGELWARRMVAKVERSTIRMEHSRGTVLLRWRSGRLIVICFETPDGKSSPHTCAVQCSFHVGCRGRGQEVPGEDPVLTSWYVKGFSTGLQHGDSEGATEWLQIISTCKHFFGCTIVLRPSTLVRDSIFDVPCALQTTWRLLGIQTMRIYQRRCFQSTISLFSKLVSRTRRSRV